jgi:hypothetical protein
VKNGKGILGIIVLVLVVVITKQLFKNRIKENAISQAVNSSKSDKVQPDTAKIQKPDTAIFKQVWFTNTQHGLAFESPKAIKGGKTEIPAGTEDYFSSVYSYVLQQDNFSLNYSVMDTYFKSYDTKTALKGAVTNLMNTANATDLDLRFGTTKSKYKNSTCDGDLNYKGVKMIIRGYCLFKSGRVFIIICSGQEDKLLKKKLNRVFGSIKTL